MKTSKLRCSASLLLELLQVASAGAFRALALEAFKALPQETHTALLTLLRPMAEMGDWRQVQRILDRRLELRSLEITLKIVKRC